MNIKTIFFSTLFIVSILCGFMVAAHQRHILGNAQKKLEQHARIIASALWKYETEDPLAYLGLAAESNHYRRIAVMDDVKNEFISVTGPLPGKTERLFIDLGLIPVKRLTTPVIYENTNIGEIRVQWYNRAVYSYLYASFCLALTFCLLWFFLSLARAKKTLKARVIERTAELDNLQKYLASIINSMPSLLIGVDEDHRVTHWNNTTEKETGIPSEKAQGRHLSRVFPRMSEDLGKIAHSIQNHEISLERNKPRQSEAGTCYDDVTIFPLTGDCHKGAVIRIDDATPRVRMEEMMIQSEKMLSVGGLAAGMAHEINNPLAGMMQTADVMRNRLTMTSGIAANEKAALRAGTTMEAIQKFMEDRGILRMVSTINESGRRVAAIVENMLSFARKSNAGTVSQNLRELVDKTLDLAATDYDLKKQYDFKRIEIQKEYDSQIPDVICESSKIQQVLLNILRNGAQAMQGSGTAHPCFFIRIFAGQDRDKVCVEIGDNGPGMDEKTRKRVFEPFFTTKPAGEGTGLGLSVSYFIVTETHRGTLSVESRPGKGARFTMCLPVRPV
ncbi:two-component system sensor histidine kinase NtrB [Desulfospira joergensenii]|uniref:two-component system sensor histidine kinase NtrB n=1 Tax=Desulfospira joergensenii TaxID=53329 RepID=UPI0003B7A81E|nr:ATP-binding protein [Desulfospira joergensenii]